MPPRSKVTKAKESVSASSSEEEIKKEPKSLAEEAPEKVSDSPAIPAWRAEVVEEGVEEGPPNVVKDAVVEKEEEIKEPVKEPLTLGEVKQEEAPTLDLTMPEEPSGSKGKKVFIVVFILVLIAGLVAGGLYYYKTKVSNEVPKKPESPTPTVEVTSTPTPSAEKVDLSQYKISVLNGSGIPGEAGKVKAALEKEGFKSIDTANADSYDFTTSEVSLKKGTPDAVYEAIKSAMGAYKIAKQEKELAESSEFDVQIIVGTTKSGSSPTPTATPSATKTPTPTP